MTQSEHFEFNVTPRQIEILKHIEEFIIQIKKYSGIIASEGSEFMGTLERISELGEHLKWDWKKRQVECLNEQFSDSKYLKGFVAVKEQPYTRAMSDDEYQL
jgi:hypothetical protein